MGNPISVNDGFPVVVQSINPNGTIIVCRHELCFTRKPMLLHNMARPLSAPGVLQLTLGREFRPTRRNLAGFKPFIRCTGGRHGRKWLSIIKSGRNELSVAMRKIWHIVDDIQCHRTARRTRESRPATCSPYKRVSHVHTAFSNGYNGWSGLKDVCLNHLVQVADISINTTSGASRPVSSVQRVSVPAFGNQGPIGSLQITKTYQIHRATSIYQPSHSAVSNGRSNLLSVFRLSNNAMSPHIPRVGVDVLVIV